MQSVGIRGRLLAGAALLPFTPRLAMGADSAAAAEVYEAAKKEGTVVYWSAGEDPLLAKRLAAGGFEVEVQRARKHATGGGYHILLVAVGAAIVLSYWLPRFLSGREPAASVRLRPKAPSRSQRELR